ncbi:unnamed protein product [Prunus armeniaca]|uniref:Uncharacterized protein n=1 Tax=Prunus armeniaca TaxID=36596 RepID=A0A6J5V7R6_PRUAR|nr:unnamed protein product [Prunus armeniaca]
MWEAQVTALVPSSVNSGSTTVRLYGFRTDRLSSVSWRKCVGGGRCTLGADDIPRACHCSHGPVRTVNMDRFRLLFNASPGSNLHVVRREDGAHGDGIVVHCMKCGLIPSFTKKTEKPDHYKMQAWIVLRCDLCLKKTEYSRAAILLLSQKFMSFQKTEFSLAAVLFLAARLYYFRTWALI